MDQTQECLNLVHVMPMPVHQSSYMHSHLIHTPHITHNLIHYSTFFLILPILSISINLFLSLHHMPSCTLFSHSFQITPMSTRFHFPLITSLTSHVHVVHACTYPLIHFFPVLLCISTPYHSHLHAHVTKFSNT